MTPSRGALDGAGAGSVSPRRFLQLGPVRIDSVTQGEALDVVEALIAKGRGGAVFTPNVDHVMIAHEDPAMRSAYGRADLCIADGMPIVWASHLLRSPIPERVAGSDFVPLLLARSAARGWGVYLLGGAPGVGETARRKLGELLPDLKIVGVDSPRFDPDEPLGRQADVVERVRAAHPDLVLVAFGAPKQEIWIDRARDDLRPAVLLGVGASLDFLAGAAPRAPRWMARSGLEWLFRLSREPRRLSYRYLVRDPKFLLVLGRALLRAGQGGT
ncbi:MAG: WecB/TagA/CpsF family glycosyltransferase [Polyangiaceae bacterium]|jgi:N-acetylglucosaminyldiphosphoundecaprenol N-acetyl-beta-D-mannosaminyltransferase